MHGAFAFAALVHLLTALGASAHAQAAPAVASREVTSMRPAAAQPARADTTPRPHAVRIVGIVYDSLVGAPLAGAMITRDGDFAFTDSAGRFAMDGVPARAITFELSHPALDSIGLTTIPVSVDLAQAADSTHVVLAVPALATVATRVCGSALAPNAAILYGTLRSAVDDAVPPDASVELSSIALDSAGARLAVRTTRASAAVDSVGRWAACGVSATDAIELRASAGGRAGARVTVSVGPRRIARVDLLAAPGGAGGLGTVARTVTGTVRDSLGRTQSNVSVLLDESERPPVRTDADGRFRLSDVPLGSHTVVVRAIGYAPQLVPISVRATQQDTVSVRLARVVTLASVEVEARVVRQLRLHRELDERRRLGLGQFVDTALVARSGSVSTALSSLPHVTVTHYEGRYAVMLGGRRCRANVVIDGRPSDADEAADLAPNAIAAIEVYERPWDVPTEYRAPGTPPGGANGGACGTVLYWTRSGS